MALKAADFMQSDNDDTGALRANMIKKIETLKNHPLLLLSILTSKFVWLFQIIYGFYLEGMNHMGIHFTLIFRRGVQSKPNFWQWGALKHDNQYQFHV